MLAKIMFSFQKKTVMELQDLERTCVKTCYVNQLGVQLGVDGKELCGGTETDLGYDERKWEGNKTDLD